MYQIHRPIHRNSADARSNIITRFVSNRIICFTSNFFETVDKSSCLPGSAKSRVLHYDHEDPLSKRDVVGNIPFAERELEINKCVIRCHACRVVKTDGNCDIQYGLLRAGIFGRKNGYRRAKAQQDELANMLQYK